MGRSPSSSSCLVHAACLPCGLGISCFPEPLAGSAELRILLGRMLVVWGFGVTVLPEPGEPLAGGNEGMVKDGAWRQWAGWEPLSALSALMTSTFSPFPVPPSKPAVSVPPSATIGSRTVLTCSEKDGSPPSEYYWFKDGVPMPTEPKSNRAFSNSSYSLNHKTGELV